MNKKNKNVLIGFLVVLGIVLILGFSNILPFSIGTPSICSGQVLSIDPQITLETSNPALPGKKVIVASYSTLPSSECLKLRLRDSQLDALPNFESNGDVFLDIKLTSQSKVFNINQNSNQLFKKIAIKNIGYELFCTQADCRSSGITDSSYIASGYPLGSPGDSDCACYYEQSLGVGGDFQISEQLYWATDVQLGNEPKLRLTNAPPNAKTSGYVGGDVAFVEWSGNLGSNAQFGSLAGAKDTYKPYSNNIWRMIPQGTYNAIDYKYNDAYSRLRECDFTGECTTANTKATSLSAYFDSNTIDQTDSWADSESFVEFADVNSNQLIVFLGSPIIYPTFRLIIDAEEVGIFQTTGGKPQLTCPSNFNIVSGETSRQNIKIKNPGSATGTYEYSLSCNKGSQQLSPNSPFDINSGNTLDVFATMGLTVVEGTDSSSCTFTALEKTTREQSSCTFSYTSTHQSQCTEGTKICEVGNSQLWTCKADGSYDKVNCQFGCEAFENDYRCRLQAKEICTNGIDDDGDGKIDKDDVDCTESDKCKWYDIPCQIKNLFSGLLTAIDILKYIIVFLVSILSIFVTQDLIKGIKGLKDKKQNLIRWLIALGIGVGIFFALYSFLFSKSFWIVAIIGLAYLFLSSYIKRFIPKFRK